ncbi:MAG: FtsW/RodA/SpoVE family cell cycle protein, partial [Clostridia bacterium]|nr:FtsW/RodA/SpoVE family cell cycle protein [Clostridia bacterium]
MRRILGAIADYIRECDKVLFLLCILASGYGCVAVLSATQFIGTNRQFMTQALALVLGLVAAIVASGVDYRKLAKWWPVLAVVGVVPVLLTFYVGYAPAGTDDKAWLALPGGMYFQPAELMKLAFMITFAAHLSAVKDRINNLKILLPVCLHAAFPVLLVHFQGDDGTAMIFAFMVLAMLAAAGLKARYFIIAGVAVLVMLPIIYFLVMNDAQQGRILSMLDLEDDLWGDDWQQWRARIAMAGGGFFGQGIFKGQLVQKGNIPEGYNDFIFSSIGEEFGLFGCLVVVALLSGICLRILYISKKSTDDLGSYICVGYFAMLASQCIINIGMCISLLPVVGITLPFFSSGGSSLACTLLGIGPV